MSETANPVVPPKVENNSNDLKSEQDKPATNDVANETKVNNDLAPTKEAATPASGRQPRRKRTSELVDSSLVIDTPGGDGGRRQTRSQTRGTPAPAPAPTPAKKPALEKASNGSAAKGRRGRPPKAAGDEKPAEAAPAEESKEEPKPTPKETKVEPEKKAEATEEKAEKPEEKTKEAVTSPPSGEKVPPEVVKLIEKEEGKPEVPIKVNLENNQAPLLTPVVKEKINEKSISESPEKVIGENKANNENSETVNNHEQQA